MEDCSTPTACAQMAGKHSAQLAIWLSSGMTSSNPFKCDVDDMIRVTLVVTSWVLHWQRGKSLCLMVEHDILHRCCAAQSNKSTAADRGGCGH